jgi:hypothetical protein
MIHVIMSINMQVKWLENTFSFKHKKTDHSKWNTNMYKYWNVQIEGGGGIKC